MNSVLAIILNWNEIDLTFRCIQSLIDMKRTNCDILVIDNGSKENPETLFKHAFPKISFIRNEQNLGVAGGRNVGIRFGLIKQYPYLLLFDNDAFAHQDMLYHLIRTSEEINNCGIAGPKILIDGEERIVWRAGCTSWKRTYLHSLFEILRRIYAKFKTPLPKFIDTVRGENQIDSERYNKDEDIDFQIGCAQLVRREVFLDIGLLDDEFSPYGSEDIDFCIRTKRSGWTIRYLHRAICWHRRESSVNDSYKRSYFNARNLILLARKNLSKAYFWIVFIPDLLLITIPLMIIESSIKRYPLKRKAIVDAVSWNLDDIRNRGVFL